MAAANDVRHQRYHGTSSRWDNPGATTTSATKDVWSATRGTRKFRVVASHVVVGSAESAPVYVTWDEWAIVAGMIGELSAAVATSSYYTNAQTALLTCMSATSTTSTGSGPKSPSDSRAPTMPPAVTFATFDDLLASYTGDVKARMEAGGDCAATSTTMFTRNESVARAELARLKAGNVVYLGLLETPHGRQFEANVDSPQILRLFAYLVASATTTQPGRLTAPLYATGASGTDEPSDTWNLESGFGCLPTDVEGDNLILTHKLEVFNCLFLATPYDFWATSAEGLKADPRFNTWLDYGDWVCTDPAPEGPVVSCRKHDVAYGSLKKFVGDSADDDTLDEAWNPRNKALADAEFFSDVAFHGCDQQSGVPAFILCGTRTNVELARIYFWGVAKYNTKGWPVTVEDLWHFYLEPKFIECNGVPRLHVTGDVVTHKPNGSYVSDCCCVGSWEGVPDGFSVIGGLLEVILGLFRHLRPMNSGPRLIMGALRPRRPAQPATNPCARFRLYNPMSTASRSVFLAKPRYLTLA